ncbi:hypothetical protein VTN02DRAFT_1298 [Thermoascus thermophilus]
MLCLMMMMVIIARRPPSGVSLSLDRSSRCVVTSRLDDAPDHRARRSPWKRTASGYRCRQSGPCGSEPILIIAQTRSTAQWQLSGLSQAPLKSRSMDRRLVRPYPQHVGRVHSARSRSAVARPFDLSPASPAGLATGRNLRFPSWMQPCGSLQQDLMCEESRTSGVRSTEGWKETFFPTKPTRPCMVLRITFFFFLFFFLWVRRQLHHRSMPGRTRF